MTIDNLNGKRSSTSELRQIAHLGSYLPRHCGIATFTADLADSISELDPTLTVHSIAMSDRADYEYPERVAYQIAETDIEAYRPAADFANRIGYDVLSVQHEYGIFGGDSGSYLMNLVREVKMPIVTTLHTVLQEPSPAERTVLDELLQLSERVIVMSHKAVQFLVGVHGVATDKIDLIPHGIPEIPPTAGEGLRKELGIKGPMILTFGLLSPDKGIQFAIRAMPRIVAEHPDAVYVIVGATHPNIRAIAGESYRETLVDLAVELGVEGNVRFVDRFVSNDELVEYLGAMDYYVTPYLNPKQITSGTLAYAVGAGKAVISTPYWYAEELLADGRGVLVPFRDGDAVADAILSLQCDPERRRRMGENAAEYGKHMRWPEVARRYLESFARAKRDSEDRLRAFGPNRETTKSAALPILRMDHLVALSDDTAILQHATFSIPNRSEGYCVDDNARGLLLTTFVDGDLAALQARYLSFMLDAYNPANGRFRNFMSYQRVWLENEGSEDSHGRSVWALGALVNRGHDRGRRSVAKDLFEASVTALPETSSLRTWAYGTLGCEEFLTAFPGHDAARDVQKTLTERLWQAYLYHQTDEWPWFEQRLTYGNARLPQALFLAGNRMGNAEMVRTGLSSLDWLMTVQTGPRGVFAPIGTNGFYERGGERRFFDQQPVEAAGSVSACLSAARLTGDRTWSFRANHAFQWFLGENMLSQSLVDEATGACCDGLHPDRVNRNQGAESTLSYLGALAELRMAEKSSRTKAGALNLR